MLAGVGRSTITPPLGIRMCGYAVQDTFAAMTYEDLTATVLVLTPEGQPDEKSAVIIACDLACLTDANSDAIRDQVAGRLGTNPDGILINCSHMHLGPTQPGYQPPGSIDSAEFAVEAAAAARGPISFSRPQSAATGGYTNETKWRQLCCQEHIQGRYFEVLKDAIAGSAAQAMQHRQPTRLGSANGTTGIGVNRRARDILDPSRFVIGKNMKQETVLLNLLKRLRFTTPGHTHIHMYMCVCVCVCVCVCMYSRMISESIAENNLIERCQARTRTGSWTTALTSSVSIH